MIITNNEREVQSVTLDGITWVLNPGVSVTISKTERIVACTEEQVIDGGQGELDEATLDANVLMSLPAYPTTISVTSLVTTLFGVKNADRVGRVRASIRRLALSASQNVIVVDNVTAGGLSIGRKHGC